MILSLRGESIQRHAKGAALGKLRALRLFSTIACPFENPVFYGSFSDWCKLLFPAREAGYRLSVYRARLTSPLRSACQFVLLPGSAWCGKWYAPKPSAPGVHPKGGPQAPYVGRFQGGFPRGEIEIPPWGCFGYFPTRESNIITSPFCASRKEHLS